MEGALNPGMFNDPRIILGSLISGAFGLILFIFEIAKWVARNSAAKRAAGVLFGLDQKQDNGAMDLNAALISFVQGFQKTEQQNREERSQQWKRIEDMVNAIREQTMASKETTMVMKQMLEELKRFDEGQRRLTEAFWKHIEGHKAG